MNPNEIFIINKLPNQVIASKGMDKWIFDDVNQAIAMANQYKWIYKIVDNQKNCCVSSLI